MSITTFQTRTIKEKLLCFLAYRHHHHHSPSCTLKSIIYHWIMRWRRYVNVKKIFFEKSITFSLYYILKIFFIKNTFINFCIKCDFSDWFFDILYGRKSFWSLNTWQWNLILDCIYHTYAYRKKSRPFWNKNVKYMILYERTFEGAKRFLIGAQINEQIVREKILFFKGKISL
jgi:hypothetical protein